MGEKVNPRICSLTTTLSPHSFRRTITSRAYVTGLGLAIEAIENGYEPREVRRRLLEIEREAKAKYR
jgi:hypothetical protein